MQSKIELRLGRSSTANKGEHVLFPVPVENGMAFFSEEGELYLCDTTEEPIEISKVIKGHSSVISKRRVD